MNKSDSVNHPAHYNQGNVEVIDYIRDCIGIQGEYYFCIGNCIKYISRAEYKNNKLQDLMKCKWYLTRAIEDLDEMNNSNKTSESTADVINELNTEEFETFPVQNTFNNDLKEE